MRTVGVPVTDQQRALEFYLDTLGLEKRLDVPIPTTGGRWIEVGPVGSDPTIALVLAHDGLPAGVSTGVRLTTPDAGALHEELTSRGVEVGPLLRWPGVPPMFNFCDIDVNVLEIVEAA
jgi:catechol 2,3-dioxygenase-like lactoylglutathione lyase family enzyme